MVRLERRGWGGWGGGDSGPVTRASLHSSPATVLWTNVLLQYLQNVAFNTAVNQHQTTLASYFSQPGATGEILHYFKNVYNVEMVFSFSFLGGGDGSGSWRNGGPVARISFTVLTTVHLRIKMKSGEL